MDRFGAVSGRLALSTISTMLLLSSAAPVLAQAAAPASQSAPGVPTPAQDQPPAGQSPTGQPDAAVPPETAGVPPLVAPAPASEAPSEFITDVSRPVVSANNIDDEGFPDLGVVVGLVRGFDYGVSLTSEYSDNLLRRPDGLPGQNAGRRSDARFRPSAFAQAGLPLGRQQLFARAEYGRDIYVRNDQLNSRRLQLQAGSNLQFARCNAQVSVSRQERQNQFDLFDVVENNVQKRTNFRASAGCPARLGLSPTASVGYGMLDNSLPTRRDFDSRTFSASGGLSYGLATRGRIGVSGSYGTSRFPNRLLIVQQPDGTFQSLGQDGNVFYSVNGYAAYNVGPFIAVNGSFGYSWVKRRLLGDEAFRGTIYSAGVDYRGPRLGAGASVSRSVNPAQGGNQSFDIATRYDLSVSYPFGRAGNLFVSGSRAERDFRGLAALQPGLPVRASEKQDRFAIGASQTLGRLLSARLEYFHVRRRADPAIFNYTANNISLQLSATF